ncbi:unnamed protein product, partial [Prorocentrum cordatum]
EEFLRGGMGTRKQMAGEEDEDDILCQGAPTASVKNFCGGAASFCVSGRGAPPRGFRRKEAEEAEEGGGGGGRKEEDDEDDKEPDRAKSPEAGER